MSQRRVKSTNKTELPERQAFQIISGRYKADPSWFDKNWPELGGVLASAMAPRQKSKSPFGLTENERSFHADALNDSLSKGRLDAAEAVQALEHCAHLLRDDWTMQGIPASDRARLFKAATGKSRNSFKSNTEIPIVEAGHTQPPHHVSLLRGVVLNLDVNMRLLSITVTPKKIREVKELMRIAGIGSDTASDVAERHDDYLAEASPHGIS